jgi:hypothetical protein
MSTQAFIDFYAETLARNCRSALTHQTSFEEVQAFLFSVLEHWNEESCSGPVDAEKEGIFWYLVFAFDQWPEVALRGNRFLKKRILQCCDFLEHKKTPPDECYSPRP